MSLALLRLGQRSAYSMGSPAIKYGCRIHCKQLVAVPQSATKLNACCQNIGTTHFRTITGSNDSKSKLGTPRLESRTPRRFCPYAYVVGIGLVTLAVAAAQKSKEPKKVTLNELETHSTPENGLWIAWQDPQDPQKRWFVSAMADFVGTHPGGRQILEAGGKAAMPFWQQFSRHLDASGNPQPHVLHELRSRIVGILSEPPKNSQISDPYSLEPDRKHYTLSPLQERPYNAGQTPSKLDTFITEIPNMFVRFHTPAPLLSRYSLVVQTSNASSSLTLEDLKLQFKPVTYASVLQCTGHRRSELPKTNGLQWEVAVANVEVTGYRLWDVLNNMGIKREPEKYILAEQLGENGNTLFSTCIPLELLPENTLLAYEINNEPLSRDHGAPLRLWVPGFNGNFSVKKPDRLRIVSAKEANPSTLEKYKALRVWAPAIALSDNLVAYVEDRQGQYIFDPELRVNSMAVVDPQSLKAANSALMPIKGWAWSGGGRAITAVQFSLDNGETWNDAAITPPVQSFPVEQYAWTAWKADIPRVDEKTRVLVRAQDSEGNIQPKQSVWNPRGLRNNSWTEVVIP